MDALNESTMLRSAVYRLRVDTTPDPPEATGRSGTFRDSSAADWALLAAVDAKSLRMGGKMSYCHVKTCSGPRLPAPSVARTHSSWRYEAAVAQAYRDRLCAADSPRARGSAHGCGAVPNSAPSWYARLGTPHSLRKPSAHPPGPECASDAEQPAVMASWQIGMACAARRSKVPTPDTSTLRTTVPLPEHGWYGVHRDEAGSPETPPRSTTHALHWYAIPLWLVANDTVTAGADVTMVPVSSRADGVRLTRCTSGTSRSTSHV
mmetsp:Transcript_17861/g.52928  ORF Transcript_17861/g.52928 Transcript_17861/m.52928 type:complete len:263 (+) Transcript_17861:3176-3964(+)